MSFWFGDGFDLYALPADATLGYWDSGTLGSASLVAGRFTGSRAWMNNSNNATTPALLKNSGSNDAVHHLTLAIQQTTAISGTTNYNWLTLSDGATAQCSIVFRSDGAILLTSGISTGTTLATYTGAITTSNTWYAFEIEIVINNTTGSIAVRKNGNTSNDFSATSLNTRGGTANNYANRLGIGSPSSGQNNYIDDLLWRSDAASVPWVGDIRCYTRRPASDAAVQWTPSGATAPVIVSPDTQTQAIAANTGVYFQFVAPSNGSVATVTMQCVTAATASYKMSLYASSGTAPTTVLGSATVVTNPGAGTVTFTFSTPVSVVGGISYWIGVCASAASGTFRTTAANTGVNAALTYATFPVASPTGLAVGNGPAFVVVVTPSGTVNSPLVADQQQDAAASYVYSSTVGQADLYTLTGIDSTPTTIIGVTTRALAQKSDAGTRIITADLQSGATKVSSSPGVLNSGVWGWVYRTDLTDPATSAAWTPTGVNNARIGVTVTG